LQKQLILRLGELSGRPATSGLHIHPVLNSEGEVGEQRDPDQEISTISSKLFSKVYGRSPDGALNQKKQSADQWYQTHGQDPTLSKTFADPFALLSVGIRISRSNQFRQISRV